MTRTCATALRFAVLGLTVATLGGCLPIMFDREGNWRGQQPIGPAFGSASQPAVPVVTADPVVTTDDETPAAD